MYITLQFDGHTFRDVILVNLGFHMCRHCVSIHAYSLFLGLKNDKYASGKSKKSERRAIGRNDLIPGSVGEIDRR